MLQWIWGCFCSFKLVFWVSSDTVTEVRWLGHKTVSFLIFWGFSILLSKVAVQVCIPTNSAKVFPFLHILASSCCLLIIAIMTGVRWYLILNCDLLHCSWIICNPHKGPLASWFHSTQMNSKKHRQSKHVLVICVCFEIYSSSSPSSALFQRELYLPHA